MTQNDLDTFLAKLATMSACPTCREPHCCKQIVAIISLDVQIILQELGSRLAEYKDRLLDQAKTETAHRTASSYFLQRRPCVFLDGTRCSIYAFRPFECLALWMLKSATDGHTYCSTDCLAFNRSIPFINMEIARDEYYRNSLQGWTRDFPGQPFRVYRGLASGLCDQAGWCADDCHLDIEYDSTTKQACGHPTPAYTEMTATEAQQAILQEALTGPFNPC